MLLYFRLLLVLLVWFYGVWFGFDIMPGVYVVWLGSVGLHLLCFLWFDVVLLLAVVVIRFL